MKRNIESVVKNGACASCGVCAGVCPKECIEIEIDQRNRSKFFPKVDENQCVGCGLCLDVCGGLSKIGHQKDLQFNSLYNEQISNIKNYYTGFYSDTEFIKSCASGGIAKALITTLLSTKMYDAAFCVDDVCFDKKVKAKAFFADTVGEIGRSKYVAVTHEDTAKYMVENRNSKIIIVGTSCAIESITNVINRFNLNRDNYLLIGLFCDKTMTYNVWDYMNKKYSGKLTEMHFRYKNENGWPGIFRIKTDKESIDLPKRDRMVLKDYFCQERCIYCTDKLNYLSDISLGDNYTKENDDNSWGSSEILLRTERGCSAFDSIKDRCTLYDTTIEKIAKSQELKKKGENFLFCLNKFDKNIRLNVKLFIKLQFKKLKIFAGKKSISCPFIMRFLMLLKK